jgi:hypothetical protein
VQTGTTDAFFPPAAVAFRFLNRGRYGITSGDLSWLAQVVGINVLLQMGSHSIDGWCVLAHAASPACLEARGLLGSHGMEPACRRWGAPPWGARLRRVVLHALAHGAAKLQARMRAHARPGAALPCPAPLPTGRTSEAPWVAPRWWRCSARGPAAGERIMR